MFHLQTTEDKFFANGYLFINSGPFAKTKTDLVQRVLYYPQCPSVSSTELFTMKRKN